MSENIGHALRKVQRGIHHKMEMFKQESGDDLTFVQASTLHYIYDHQNENVYQKDIEKILNVRRSTATEILNVLERDGYIERHSIDSDRRLKKLVLTDKAIRLHESMIKNIDHIEKLLRTNISDEELAIFFKVMDTMHQNVKGDLYD